MAAKTYNPDEVILTFGPVPLGGYGPGTFITVERDERSFTKMVGADGEVSRTRNKNQSGKVRFRVRQSSATNDILSGYLGADEAGGVGVFPLEVKDLSGTTLLTAANAWIDGVPTAEFGKEEAEREWVIECDKLVGLLGGNNDSPSE